MTDQKTPPIPSAELLIVEDDPRDLELTLRALKKAKVSTEIKVARDGVEALEYIFCEGSRVAQPRIEQPKVILLDLKLPKVDGLDVLKRLKSDRRTKMIPVVVLTSSKEQSDLLQSYELGVNSYVVKPVKSETFAETVRDLGVYWLVQNEFHRGTD